MPSENLTLFGNDSADVTQPGNPSRQPLAETLRPQTLDDLVGLEELVGPGRFLRLAIERDNVPSLILWGPPGSGKTTIARIIARETKARFVPFSATSASIKDVRSVMEEAARGNRRGGRPTLVFIDEIHRFNKGQQDAFLPHVEAGEIVLIGATTENPSFEVNSALLSRCRVVVIPRLESDAIVVILNRALESAGIKKHALSFKPEALPMIASTSGGDARQALNTLEIIAETSTGSKKPIGPEEIQKILQRRMTRYDKGGEEHYNIISALHKSIRNGDPDAAVYWLVRMLEGGEDPMYLARRLVRAAAEDIGLADPQALTIAVSAKDAMHFIGMPEGGIVLAELAIYLAQSPKSNAVYSAYNLARRTVREGDDPPVPLHLRNAPTALMKNLGYGSGYQYAHEFEEQTAAMECLPESLSGHRFYEPGKSGFEVQIAERIDRFRRARGLKK